MSSVCLCGTSPRSFDIGIDMSRPSCGWFELVARSVLYGDFFSELIHRQPETIALRRNKVLYPPSTELTLTPSNDKLNVNTILNSTV